MNKKSNKFLLVILVVFFLVGCKKNDVNKETESSQTNVESSFTKEEQEAIDNGHQVGDYRIFLTNKNKKSKSDIVTFLENDFFEKSFLDTEYQIDPSKKINLITYTMHYSPEEERYSLGVFLVNTSGKNIQSIKMLVKPTFKNIKEGEFGEIYYSKEDFIDLPDKGVVPKPISANAPIEYLDKLKENTAADITFEIKDLELNGEKVSNEN